MKKTGRNSEALSKALDSLIKQCLVDVRDKAGKPLLTPQQRRQARGRIYYALHPLLFQHMRTSEAGAVGTSPADASAAGKRPDNAGHVKSELADELDAKESTSSCSVFKREDRKSEHPLAAKANRTKETDTKEIGIKETATTSLFPQSDVGAVKTNGEVALGYLLSQEQLFDIRDMAALPPAMEGFIKIYCQAYARHFPNATPPAVFNSALARLHNLQQRHTETEMTKLLDLFFSCELAHIARQQYSLEAFVHNINILKETCL